MNEFLENSLFAGVTISLLAYMAGAFLKKKFKTALLNPLLISIILSIVVLVTADIDYDVYNPEKDKHLEKAYNIKNFRKNIKL